MRSIVVCLGLLASLLARAACSQDTSSLKALESHELHNLWQLSPRIYSGSEPENEAAFAELAKMGITTIVSVDGIQPQVELARKYGLRYVHVPIGYDGIDSQAQGQLVRVAQDVQGKIYIHCHHGKHRGPAAAAIVCQADDGRSAAQAKIILEKAGTGKEYPGLWRDVASFKKPLDTDQLPPLVERAEVESLAANMARLDRIFDHLKQFQKNQWKSLADHPDLVADQEALQVAELLTESARTTAEPMKKAFTESAQLMQELRSALAKQETATADRLMKQLSTRCTACHQAHRNTNAASERQDPLKP